MTMTERDQLCSCKDPLPDIETTAEGDFRNGFWGRIWTTCKICLGWIAYDRATLEEVTGVEDNYRTKIGTRPRSYDAKIGSRRSQEARYSHDHD